jgi:hypothetical protein
VTLHSADAVAQAYWLASVTSASGTVAELGITAEAATVSTDDEDVDEAMEELSECVPGFSIAFPCRYLLAGTAAQSSDVYTFLGPVPRPAGALVTAP